MFDVVTPVFSDSRNPFVRKKIYCSEKSYGKGSFRHIEAIIKKGKYNSHKLKRLLKNSKSGILFSLYFPGVPSWVQVHNSDSYREILTYNAFMLYLSKLSRKGLIVGIYDLDGELLQKIPVIVEYAEKVLIRTDNAKAFKNLCSKTIADFGASPIICKNDDQLKECITIFSTGGYKGFGSLVFGSGGLCADQAMLSLPEPVLNVIPPDIDKIDFASLMYADTGNKFLLSIVPAYVKDGINLINLNQKTEK